MTKHPTVLDHKRRAARQRRERRTRRRKLVALLIGVVAVALAAILATTLLNQEGTKPEVDAANHPAAMDSSKFMGGPRLAVDQTLVDHGEVPYGYEVTAEYRLQNVGNQVLRIGNPEVKILDGC